MNNLVTDSQRQLARNTALTVVRNTSGGRDLCDNCGKCRLLKPVGSAEEVYFICRPCKQAFKAAAKQVQQ